MKLIIIRHGDPNYEIDSLTPTGWREAELLSRRVSKWDVKAFYTSPLGRARDTARPTLEKMGREATVLDWLREFPLDIVKEGETKPSCCWDWLPADWTSKAHFYDRDAWMDDPAFASVDMRAGYKYVTDGLDALLAEHGYRRENGYYRVTEANSDTIVLFCHFGLQCVLLSHLLGVSPMVFWHGLCAAPSSVTTIYTEERRRGIAAFRVASFGDTSHLYVAGEQPSFSARFCETYDNFDQRHD
ncbi:MAG: histidine phosphatase family protein [Ruminococcaceae bacterium]|nr:histidine phosphatase family protein [Oscillospiraceae bacterium]